ncbi:MAG: alpha/beta hydrolase, partial [Bacteroidota bacterium]|nr:alpha/beta hydrolase [Bacteroidota bacterium]
MKRLIHSFLFLLIFLLMKLNVAAQKTMPLYSDSIPNSRMTPDEETTSNNGVLIISKVSRPTLTAYFPPKEKANGTAVIICPGGGYGVLAAAHEGSDVAKEFAKAGVAAFVLKYRLPDDATMMNKEIGPLQDAQEAIKTVREKDKEWNIDAKQIGIMGFSAGGHLASTAGTHYNKAVIANPNNTS